VTQPPNRETRPKQSLFSSTFDISPVPRCRMPWVKPARRHGPGQSLLTKHAIRQKFWPLHASTHPKNCPKSIWWWHEGLVQNWGSGGNSGWRPIRDTRAGHLLFGEQETLLLAGVTSACGEQNKRGEQPEPWNQAPRRGGCVDAAANPVRLQDGVPGHALPAG
jgi:hypothetical protein